MNLTYNVIQDQLRTLAKSTRYQTDYGFAKEGTVQLFENKRLTSIQREFLFLLAHYYNIFIDVATGEVSDKVLENEIRLEAYSIYKNKKFKDQKKKVEKENLINKTKNKKTHNTVTTKTYKFVPPNR